MVHTEYNQHKFAIFQIMTPYSTHSVTLEFPTYSLVHNSLNTHGCVNVEPADGRRATNIKS